MDHPFPCKLPYFRDLQFDVSLLREETLRLIKKFPWKGDVLCLTHREGSPAPMYEAASVLKAKKMSPDGEFVESRYTLLNDAVKGTYFEEVIEKVRKASPFPLARIRLIKLPPLDTFYWHHDDEYRYFLPIFTHPHCFLITEPSHISHIPADGRVYIFDARKFHTITNCDGQTIRIMLNFVTYENCPEAFPWQLQASPWPF